MRSHPFSQLTATAIAGAALAFLACPDAAAQQVFFDDFDNPTTSTWSSTSGVTVAAVGNLGSNAFHFDQAATRFAVTELLDLSAGRPLVRFWLRYEGNTASGPDDANFDELDTASDAILLEYSTDGGSIWNLVETFPESGDTFRLGNVSSQVLPSGAWTGNVMVRMWQDGTAVAAAQDQWALDDFEIVFVPEPATWALFGLGTAGIGAWVRRRRAARRAPAAAAGSAG